MPARETLKGAAFAARVGDRVDERELRRLFHDAFAYRPLPRMRVDGPLTRRLPGRLREYTAWTPHAVITGAALFTLLMATVDSGDAASPHIDRDALPVAEDVERESARLRTVQGRDRVIRTPCR